MISLTSTAVRGRTFTLISFEILSSGLPAHYIYILYYLLELCMQYAQSFPFIVGDRGGGWLLIEDFAWGQSTISLSTFSHRVHIGTSCQTHAQLDQPLGKHEEVYDWSLNPKRWGRAYRVSIDLLRRRPAPR